MFQITVNKSGEQVDHIRCVASQCLVGSSRDCLVRLRGFRIPPEAAQIRLVSQGVEVSPTANQQEVTVAGEQSALPRLLDDQTPIQIGRYELFVALEEEGEEAVTKLQEQSQSSDDHSYMSWVRRVHDELLRQMDLRRTDVSALGDDELRHQVKAILLEVIELFDNELPAEFDRTRLLEDVLNEAVGLGPLEGLLADPSVTEIMVNRFNDIFIERAGKLERTEVTFSDDAAVRSAIDRIVAPIGRRIDESSPLVDARLKDGSRVNAVIPPLALRGPCITIRKFSEKKLTGDDLINFGAANRSMMDFLKLCVEQRRNVVISGGTGSGKTTLLNVLSNFIPSGERVVTVEDAAELRLVQPHLVSLEARPANIEGKGQVSIRDLVKNCLRMRPDRIVVGECRGGEALDMLQAMNTGHDGSLTTAHANSPADLLSRLEVMVLMSGLELPVMAIREQIGSAVDLVVQQSRFADGSRRISAICEVLGVEEGKILLEPVFRYEQTGFDSEGRVQGHFTTTGYTPKFIEGLREQGVAVDDSLFRAAASSNVSESAL